MGVGLPTHGNWAGYKGPSLRLAFQAEKPKARQAVKREGLSPRLLCLLHPETETKVVLSSYG